MQTMTINGTEQAIREFQGQRVVTLKDIDTVHQRPADTARRNFRKNKGHFVHGVDYFGRNSSEARTEFGISAPNGLTLLTESGYLMLVKSFTDDLAWKVQRELVNCYFKVRAPKQTAISEQLALPLESIAKDYSGNNAIQGIIQQIERNAMALDVLLEQCKLFLKPSNFTGYQDALFYTSAEILHLSQSLLRCEQTVSPV